MRPIKFRAWDKENKRWMTPEIEDVEESEVRLSIWGDVYFRKPWFEQNHNNVAIVDGSEMFDIMLHTGLKDKNGVEIYEGDIVKWGHLNQWSREQPHRIAEVKFDPDIQFHSQVGVFNFGSFAYRDTTETDLEVIGNIYENPELEEQNK